MVPVSGGCCLNGFLVMKWEKYSKAQRTLAVVIVADFKVLHYFSFKESTTSNKYISPDSTMGYKSVHKRVVGKTFCGMT